MSGYLSFLSGFVLGLLEIGFVTMVGRFVISHWLEGRALAIATLASGVAYTLGRNSFSGPLDAETLNALGHLSGAGLALLMIGKIWLGRINDEEAR